MMEIMHEVGVMALLCSLFSLFSLRTFSFRLFIRTLFFLLSSLKKKGKEIEKRNTLGKTKRINKDSVELECAALI